MEEYQDRLEVTDHTNDIPVIQEECCQLLEFFFLLAQTEFKIVLVTSLINVKIYLRVNKVYKIIDNRFEF